MQSLLTQTLVTFFAVTFASSAWSVPIQSRWIKKSLEQERLMQGVEMGALYLVRNQLPNGQFVYIKDPLGLCCRKRPYPYSFIRHLGAVYSLLKAFELTRDKQFLVAAHKGLEFVHQFLVTNKSGQFIVGLKSKPSFGSNGFYLTNMVLYDHFNNSKIYVHRSQNVAKFLMKKLHFHSDIGTPKKWAECQAIMGLVNYQLYGFWDMFGNAIPKTISRSMARIIGRWLEKTMKNDIHNHWTIQAHLAFYQLDPVLASKLAQKALKKGRQLLKGVLTVKNTNRKELWGTRRGQLHGSSISARNEGILAAYKLARETGHDRYARYFLRRGREHLAHTLQYQYGVDGNFYQDKPKMQQIARNFNLLGGIFDDPQTGHVRIDYVAHFIRSIAYYLHFTNQK